MEENNQVSVKALLIWESIAMTQNNWIANNRDRWNEYMRDRYAKGLKKTRKKQKNPIKMPDIEKAELDGFWTPQMLIYNSIFNKGNVKEEDIKKMKIAGARLRAMGSGSV